ncbi:Na+-exporting ATPase [Wickerhamomyces ciferrii]|uniref:P-type Na(+) transporter n=1 Tax=Wickerhamomyces ciferrii (strain ATCC 14091 / BCRC 22168 / CBS 111 / JCM 3599 / NBRC 0793 / NRRL Y-1031 F-60-10) TaxID=1206466 RepID=K0KJC4_WICCF|nr:Na+-exporting ATPase [Wickerhamomyces ciferrii]CCH43076.1 Na+-exporting ATPase [Wickerhamomyces ciferrii]
MSSSEDAKLNHAATIGTKGTYSSSDDGQTFDAYRETIETTEKFFKTNIQEGLSEQTADQLLKQWGENTLGDDQKINVVKIIVRQSCNAMILVLIISMAIALGIKDWISGGVIAFVVGINVGIGSLQEYKASKTMNSLKSLSSPTARAIRNGELKTIPTKFVVPGDVVSVKVGDTIPADLRIVDCLNFETDEALLTGESLPVAKEFETVYHEEIGVGDRLNMAFSSSVVTKGRATGIAVKTGLQTEIGEIAQSLKSQKKSLHTDDDNSAWKNFLILIKDGVGSFLGTTVGTPLSRKLSKLAIGLFIVAVLFAIIVMATQKMVVPSEVAIYAICVALSMIPSSLVVVLTITMSAGAKTMVQRNVIIRKLDSLEALGSINDICSDKTGTLTQGKMLVKAVWVPSSGTYNVHDTSDPFNPTIGTLSYSSQSPSENSKDHSEKPDETNVDIENSFFQNWLYCATLANIATVFKDEHGDWKAHGDPTEIAIQVFAYRNGLPRSDLTKGDLPKYKHINEFPFDSSVKKMSAIYNEAGNEKENKVYTKGAVERVLQSCKNWYVNGELKPLTEEDQTSIEENMNSLSGEGLRVLAFATKTIPIDHDTTNRDTIESDLTFLGLVGIYDPPRLESLGAVKKCHKAGINVHMLTGDHPGTARTIAQEVGILPHNLYHYAQDVVESMVMTAKQFDDLTDAQIDELPVLPLVIARCAPQTKVRMIDALHRRKKFCAMTGDGVNDSPSLKKADVGIAMGIAGSDVAKDVSDIVLSDDNFASIINGIEEGRRMNDNIQKFVLQLLAENVAQALYLMIGLAFKDVNGLSVFPLSPVEVLWIIVITSCFPAMGLGLERAQPDVMHKDPKPSKESVFSKEMLVDLLCYGFWMAICCLGCFLVVTYDWGNGELGTDCNKEYSDSCYYIFRSRSASFATMTWCALVLAWEVIDMRRSLFAMQDETETPYTQVFKDLWSNQFLFWSVVGGFISVFPVVYIPVINKVVFLHGPIGKEWGLAFAFTIAFWIGCEFYKFLKRQYLKKQTVHNPEHDLEKKNPFDKYASFSRAGTMQPGA